MKQRRQELEIQKATPIPSQWEETVAACLEKDPAKRPQSAREVAEKLGLAASTVRSPVMVTGSPTTRLASASGLANLPAEATGSVQTTGESPRARKRWPMGVVGALCVISIALWYFGQLARRSSEELAQKQERVAAEQKRSADAERARQDEQAQRLAEEQTRKLAAAEQARREAEASLKAAEAESRRLTAEKAKAEAEARQEAELRRLAQEKARQEEEARQSILIRQRQAEAKLKAEQQARMDAEAAAEAKRLAEERERMAAAERQRREAETMAAARKAELERAKNAMKLGNYDFGSFMGIRPGDPKSKVDAVLGNSGKIDEEGIATYGMGFFTQGSVAQFKNNGVILIILNKNQSGAVKKKLVVPDPKLDLIGQSTDALRQLLGPESNFKQITPVVAELNWKKPGLHFQANMWAKKDNSFGSSDSCVSIAIVWE
jgi:hypothetical protein